ncbi:MAG: hypothetical protein J0L52_09500 [Caulobacterales bacterium]|nr:hypothetical protein [Caulobacterales bacterium]
MIVIGLFLAGLVLALKELVPWAMAQTSGQIRTRGHSRQVIRRADDPERFRSLSRNRIKASGLGIVIMLAAIGITIGQMAIAIANEAARFAATP